MMQSREEGTQAEVTDGIRPEDFTVDVVVKSMGGFAQINTNGVRVTHKPTGISVTCDAARSQHANRHQAFETLRAILALRPQQSGLTGCNCRWDGDTQVQWCELHLAHKDAIHEWAERAKEAEKQLALRPERVPMTPDRTGIYAWVSGTSCALVIVNQRPSDHAPGGQFNGHVIDSTRFYSGCAIVDWGRDGNWTLLHDLSGGITAQAKKETP